VATVLLFPKACLADSSRLIPATFFPPDSSYPPMQTGPMRFLASRYVCLWSSRVLERVPAQYNERFGSP